MEHEHEAWNWNTYNCRSRRAAHAEAITSKRGSSVQDQYHYHRCLSEGGGVAANPCKESVSHLVCKVLLSIAQACGFDAFSWRIQLRDRSLPMNLSSAYSIFTYRATPSGIARLPCAASSIGVSTFDSNCLLIRFASAVASAEIRKHDFNFFHELPACFVAYGRIQHSHCNGGQTEASFGYRGHSEHQIMQVRNTRPMNDWKAAARNTEMQHVLLATRCHLQSVVLDADVRKCKNCCWREMPKTRAYTKLSLYTTTINTF